MLGNIVTWMAQNVNDIFVFTIMFFGIPLTLLLLIFGILRLIAPSSIKRAGLDQQWPMIPYSFKVDWFDHSLPPGPHNMITNTNFADADRVVHRTRPLNFGKCTHCGASEEYWENKDGVRL